MTLAKWNGRTQFALVPVVSLNLTVEFPRTEVRSCHLQINHNKLLNLAQLQRVFQILFSSSPSVTLLVVCTIFGCYLIRQLIDTVSHVLEGISKALTS